MARRRKGTSAGHVGGAIVGAIILAIAAIPKEMWIALAIAGLIALIVWLVSKSKQTTTEPATEHSAEEETAHFEEAPRRTIQRSQPQKP